MTTEAEVLPQILSMRLGCKISWLESQHAVSRRSGECFCDPLTTIVPGLISGIGRWVKYNQIDPIYWQIETWHLRRIPWMLGMSGVLPRTAKGQGSARFHDLFPFRCIAQFGSQKEIILSPGREVPIIRFHYLIFSLLAFHCQLGSETAIMLSLPRASFSPNVSLVLEGSTRRGLRRCDFLDGRWMQIGGASCVASYVAGIGKRGRRKVRETWDVAWVWHALKKGWWFCSPRCCCCGCCCYGLQMKEINIV